MAWLLAITRFQQTRAVWWLVVAAVALGAGVYSGNAAAIMMPAYFALTATVLALSGEASPRQLAWFAGAFAATGGPFVLHLLLNRDQFRTLVLAHRLYDVDRFNILQGMREMVSWVGLTARSEVYYDYFNPAFLFLTGHVLLFPLAVLLPAGLIRILTNESTPIARLSWGGFFAAPLAATLTAETPIPQRTVFLLPFAAVVSGYGVHQLLAWFHALREHRRSKRG
jgi:hypothetical protein